MGVSMRFVCFLALLPALFFAGCSRQAPAAEGAPAALHEVALQPGGSAGSVPASGAGVASGAGGASGDLPAAVAEDAAGYMGFFSTVLRAAELPQDLYLSILNSMTTSADFILDLMAIMEGDPSLWRLVDKDRSLPNGYSPGDLVELVGGSYSVSRPGLMLRRGAAASLEEMAAAARADGVTLVAASAYRSFQNQVQVHNHWVQVLGREEAERVSARPGHSEHQLGLALDFAPINTFFAQTREGVWLDANAARFGWSLSYPYGFEDVTGYSWEPWHFRYVGRELVAFINNHFDGIQQFALRFIYEWEKAAAGSPAGEAHGG